MQPPAPQKKKKGRATGGRRRAATRGKKPKEGRNRNQKYIVHQVTY